MSNDGFVHDQSLQSRVRRPQGLADSSLITDASTFFLQIAEFADELPRWTYWPHRRDRLLRKFFKTEPIFSGTVYSMASRVKAIPIQLSGPKEQAARKVLRLADFNGGFPQLVQKTVQDLATTDNGAFWELVGPGRPDGQLLGPPTAVEYLDSAQCYRTFSPEYPVYYVNPVTRDIHKLHRSRVVQFSNMTQPDELARDIGFCVLSRALSNVQTIRAMNRFRHEKVTGRFERGIIFGKGTTARTLEAALGGKQSENEAIGLTYYGKIPVLTSIEGVELDLLELSQLPDGFDLVDEVTLYVYAIALAWGVDAREFWPATASGATKADATVQHMKAQGKGIADYITLLESALNERILPPGTTAEFDYVDDEHDKAVREQQEIRVRALSTLKRDGVLDQKLYMAHLLKEGILNPEIVRDADEIIKDADPELLSQMEELIAQAEELRGNLAEQQMNGTMQAPAFGRTEPDESRRKEDKEDEGSKLASDQYPFRR